MLKEHDVQVYRRVNKALTLNLKRGSAWALGIKNELVSRWSVRGPCMGTGVGDRAPCTAVQPCSQQSSR